MNKMVLVSQDRYDRLLRKCDATARTDHEVRGETAQQRLNPEPNTSQSEERSPQAPVPMPPPGIMEEKKAQKGKRARKPETLEVKRTRKKRGPKNDREENGREREQRKRIVESWIHF